MGGNANASSAYVRRGLWSSATHGNTVAKSSDRRELQLYEKEKARCAGL